MELQSIEISKPVVNALLVNLNGIVKFHVEKIIEAIHDGTIDKYNDLSSGRLTLLDSGKYRYGSFLYHNLGDLITYGTNENGWYLNTWSRYFGNELSKCILDIIFYDEFLFLISEGLLEVEEYELLSEQKIWSNADRYFKEQKGIFDDRLNSLYNAKSLEALKKEFRNLMKINHPDKGGDTELTALIIDCYLSLKRNF